MKLRYKIGIGILGFFAIAIVSLGVVLSYEESCPGPATSVTQGETMQAVMQRCYGSAEDLHIEDVVKPVPGDDAVLVKIKAAGVNPLDWHYMRGSPYFMRLGSGTGAPDDPRMGVDFAGTVEAVGKDVTRFKAGDEVFGGRSGAFAEYIVVAEDRAIAHKPSNITFEQAAAVPIAAITALQALRDNGKLESGQRVLINGASGGVGTFAVQISKAYGAEVSGVCSTRNVEMVRSLGADHVFDYTRENYTESGQKFDLIIDMVGNHSILANRKAMTDTGRLVIVGGPKGNWLGPVMGPISAMVVSPFIDQEIGMILASMDGADLEVLADLMEAGKVSPVIDRHYPFNEYREAITYSESGRARGKIIIRMD